MKHIGNVNNEKFEEEEIFFWKVGRMTEKECFKTFNEKEKRKKTKKFPLKLQKVEFEEKTEK